MERVVSVGPGRVAARIYLDIGVTVLDCQTGSLDGERSGRASAPENMEFILVRTQQGVSLAFLVQFYHLSIWQAY